MDGVEGEEQTQPIASNSVSKVYPKQRMIQSTTIFKKTKLIKTQTIDQFINNYERKNYIQKNYSKIFRSQTRKLIIVLQFFQSLQQYSKEKLQMKAEYIKYKRQTWLPLYPDDLAVRFWYKINQLAMLAASIVFPLYLAFEQVNTLTYVIDGLFGLDILIALSTAAVDEDFNLKTDFAFILKSSLQRWLIADVLALLPYKEFSSERSLCLLKLIKVLKFLFYSPNRNYKGQHTGVVMKETMTPDTALHISEGIVFFTTVILKALLLIHIFGCLQEYYFGFGYITSIYWSTQTITMIGYGDIDQNQTFTTIWIIIGIGYYSQAIGNFAQLIARSNLDQEEELKQLEELTNKADLPERLAQEMRGFVQTNLGLNPCWNQLTSKMIASLPYQIQQYLVTSSMLEVCRKVHLFLEDVNATTELSKACRFVVADKEKILYREGQNSNEIFYLIKGRVSIMSRNKYPLLNILEGSLFGEIEAVDEIERLTYAMVLERSLILIMRYKQLKKQMCKSGGLKFEVCQLQRRRKQLLIHAMKEEQSRLSKYIESQSNETKKKECDVLQVGGNHKVLESNKGNQEATPAPEHVIAQQQSFEEDNWAKEVKV